MAKIQVKAIVQHLRTEFRAALKAAVDSEVEDEHVSIDSLMQKFESHLTNSAEIPDRFISK